MLLGAVGCGIPEVVARRPCTKENDLCTVCLAAESGEAGIPRVDCRTRGCGVTGDANGLVGLGNGDTNDDLPRGVTPLNVVPRGTRFADAPEKNSRSEEGGSSPTRGTFANRGSGLLRSTRGSDGGINLDLAVGEPPLRSEFGLEPKREANRLRRRDPDSVGEESCSGGFEAEARRRDCRGDVIRNWRDGLGVDDGEVICPL